MKKIIQLKFFLILLLGVLIYVGNAQEKSSVDTLLQITPDLNNHTGKKKKERKNTIHINITNPLLISNKYQTIGYERILPHNQSFTVNVGTFSLPRFTNGRLADSLGLNTASKDKGFHFSTDYRFYLTKENKYSAPRGVYLAPYYTYNHLGRENSWNIDGHVDKVYTDLKLNIHTIGAEMGYQFVFWDRIALDL
ncbi:MAG TPA: hypothetical protein VLA03_10775, partial [Draconibacterium sp.]|nr:hypothetical protein [Draconibacterium sp.]